MKRAITMLISAILFVSMLVLGVVPGTTQAATQCPSTITSNTILTSDCLAPAAIVIAADGVEFDGGGLTVDCAPAFGNGIHIISHTRVRITNVTLIHCNIGIFVSGGGNHVFETNLNILNNPLCPPSPGGSPAPGQVRIGIAIASSNGNHIDSTNVSCNAIGIQLGNSSDNKIDSSTINDNVDPSFSAGVQMVNSSNNVITSSTLLRNGLFAIETNLGSGNTVQSSTVANTFFFGPQDAVVFFSSHNNTVRGNTVTGNRDGIALGFQSSGNNVMSNVADSNGIGIGAASGANGNTIASRLTASTPVLSAGVQAPPCPVGSNGSTDIAQVTMSVGRLARPTGITYSGRGATPITGRIPMPGI